MCNYSDENGYCYPSIAALASDTSQDRKTVIAAMGSLESAGHISDTGRRLGRTGQIKVYKINRTENGTVKESQYRNGSENGTVPFLPGKSTVFPSKESQKRYTDPSEEPSGNRQRCSTPRPTARKRCPEEFQVTEDLRTWAAANASGVDIEAQTAAFRDYEFRNGKTDWAATWRNWMRKAKPAARPNGKDPYDGAI